MLLALSLVGCGPEPVAETDAPTWHQDVAPIVAEHCGGCHVSGGIAPFSLDSYLSAGSMAEAAVAAVEAGTMPPFDAYETEDCTPRLPWKGDPRLDDDEKAILRAWADAGAPEGDPATAAPLPDAIVADLPSYERELQPAQGYATSGNGDQFMCVSMDAGILRDSWVTGVQVIPGNPVVNHHVVVFTDPHAETAAWGDEYIDCESFGGPTDTQPLAVWTPGSDPVELPDGAGIPIPAGSRVVIQIHFHPTGPLADEDISTVRLRLREDEPEHQAVITSIGNFPDEGSGLLPGPNDRDEPEFRIPRGVSDHTETMQIDIDGSQTFRFFSVYPHMHYIGTNMEVHWRRPGPRPEDQKDECLVQSGWDFDWQRNYTYDAPISELPVGRSGDTFWIQCTYDNTMDNPGVVRATSDAGLDHPVVVHLGETTLDEMCLLIVGVLI